MTALLVVLSAATLAVLGLRLVRRARPRGRAVIVVAALLAMQALIGSPAMAAPTDCAPNPERPDLGLVGALDPSNELGVHGENGSTYYDYRYAGLTWHTYDPNCGSISAITSSNSQIDTWFGNQLFNVAKGIVAATNGLHYVITGNLLVGPLDGLVASGTKALYNGVFAPLLALAALGLGVLLFRQIWRGDLAAISRRTMWALAALWVASAAYLTPLVYTEVLNKVLIFGTSEIQAGFLSEAGLGNSTNALPTMLHTNVVYRNWLRGEFGSPDAPRPSSSARIWSPRRRSASTRRTRARTPTRTTRTRRSNSSSTFAASSATPPGTSTAPMAVASVTGSSRCSRRWPSRCSS